MIIIDIFLWHLDGVDLIEVTRLSTQLQIDILDLGNTPRNYKNLEATNLYSVAKIALCFGLMFWFF